MGRLEYDDAGFAYFGIGLGTCFLVPFTYSFLMSLYRGLTGSVTEFAELKPRTQMEKKMMERMRKEKGIKGMMTQGFYVKLAVLVLGWAFVGYLLSTTQGESGEVYQFDPWQILGLSEGSSENKIKSAYRRLSLVYHPDRNVKKELDEQAKAAMMFERIQKAHEILTDKDAYNLFLETGSPDGSKQMEVSIGLPKFLMEKKNHNLVLVVYLLILVVVTPISVGTWYMNSKLYGDRLILNDSYNMFIYLLEKGLPLKYLPEVLALSAEYRKMELKSKSDMKLINDLREKMISNSRMAEDHCQKVKDGKMMERWPACDRANVLIHAYLNRLTDQLSPNLQDDLQFILSKSKLLLEAMTDTISQSRHLRSIQNMFQFEQSMSQALWILDSPLQQLPHITLPQARRAAMGEKGLKSIADFLKGDEEQRSVLTKYIENPTDLEEIKEAAKVFPDIELKVEIGVISNENRDGSLVFEEKACEGDIMTAYVELQRNHNLGPIHAPYLPYLKEEEWVILFCKTGESHILAQVKLKSGNQVVREKIQFPSKNFIKPGWHSFDFYLISTGYMNLDQKVVGKVQLFPEGTVKMQELHPEDKALEDEPTLFEEAFGRVVQEEDSDFADTDEEGEGDGSEGPIATKKSKGDDDLLASDDDGESDESTSEPKKSK